MAKKETTKKTTAKKTAAKTTTTKSGVKKSPSIAKTPVKRLEPKPESKPEPVSIESVIPNLRNLARTGNREEFEKLTKATKGLTAIMQVGAGNTLYFEYKYEGPTGLVHKREPLV